MELVRFNYATNESTLHIEQVHLNLHFKGKQDNEAERMYTHISKCVGPVRLEGLCWFRARAV